MHDLTKGSIASALLRTTTMMLVGMVFQTLYLIIDLKFVGMLGPTAVAAVGVSGNLMFYVVALTQTLGVGATALIAHAAGRKDRDAARFIFNQSQVLSVAVGLVFLVGMMALRGRFAHAQAADPETARLAGEYLTWFIPALAGQFALIATASALRGIGDFKPGMIVQSVTVVLNAVLAPVLMFGWGTGHPLGVAGTAIASFVAILVGVVALFVYVVRKKEGYLRFVVAEQRPQLATWWRMLKIGLPAGAEFLFMGVYFTVVYSITRRFNASAQAGFAVGLRVIQAVFMPVVALGFAVSPVAGQNFGARLPDRVRATFRMGALMATAAMVVLFLLCQAVPRQLVGLFNKDPGVLAIGGDYLKIVAWNFVPSGIVFVSSSMFQALGNTIPPLVSSFVRNSLLVIPAIVMSHSAGFQLNWIWYVAVVTTALHSLLNVLLLRREYGRKLAFAPPAAAPLAAAE
jgi:putative MATE family efflux protein